MGIEYVHIYRWKEESSGLYKSLQSISVSVSQNSCWSDKLHLLKPSRLLQSPRRPFALFRLSTIVFLPRFVRPYLDNPDVAVSKTSNTALSTGAIFIPNLAEVRTCRTWPTTAVASRQDGYLLADGSTERPWCEAADISL